MTNTIAAEYPSDGSILQNKWVLRVRAVWLALIVVIFITFLFSISGTHRLLMTVCDLPPDQCISWSQPTTELLTILDSYHISLQSFAIYHLVLYMAVSLIAWGAGLLVLRYRSWEWHGLLVSYLLITLGSGGVSFVFLSGLELSGLPAVFQIISSIIIMPMYLALSLFFQTFPDGRFYPQWSRLGTLLIVANYAVWLMPGQWNIENWSAPVAGLWLLLIFGSHVAIQGYRYRYYYTPEQRQQTKWLVFGFGIVLVAAVGLTMLGGLLINELFEGTIVAVGYYLPIVAAVTIAMLRFRLWDIDIIINRTLVYSMLTSLVVGIYVLVVGILSEIFQSRSNFVISLFATGIVAVSFHPLRESIQGIVNRRIFGERNNPYGVISRLSERLENNVSPKTLLPGIAEMIAETLKLSYVAITLKEGDNFKTDAVYGQPVDQGHITSLDLLYGQEVVGQLIIGQDTGDKQFGTVERQLLENIARQTGVAAHAVQLSTALQQSRQQIITAREEERRRLRRDLHDGIGPALAAHTIKVGAARALLESDPQTAAKILTELENNLSNSLVDIRRLVYNLRPPALDQLGLIGALNDFIQQCSGKVLFTLNAPTTSHLLPAAIEVAAYRIAQEGINNVLRHAQAQHCQVTLLAEDELVIRIADDGVGLPIDLRFGVGLNAIRERAEELGGQFTIISTQPHGTQLDVRLPL